MQTDTHEREYLAPKEVAHELRVHVSAVYRAVERGDLPAVRLSETGAIRIHRSAICAHVEAEATAATGGAATLRPSRPPG
jgi:excisionase family DNA binding protein